MTEISTIETLLKAVAESGKINSIDVGLEQNIPRDLGEFSFYIQVADKDGVEIIGVDLVKDRYNSLPVLIEIAVEEMAEGLRKKGLIE